MSAVADSTARIVSDTGPFTLIPEWVLDADISSTAVRLYGVLGRYTDATGICWPSRSAQARRLRARSPRTVDNALAELKGIGAVEVTPRVDPETGQTSNRYKLNRVQPAAHPLAESCEGGVAEDCEGPLAKICSQNESQSEREPVEREPLLDGAQKSDTLVLRLAKVCVGPRVKVWPESTKVVDLLRKYFADHVIDEGIGVCELLATPPTFPRYLLSVIQERSQETGQYIPDLVSEFEGDAA